MTTHPFQHLGRQWQLYQRQRRSQSAIGNPKSAIPVWHFRLRSGKLDAPFCLRHATTGEPLPLDAALAAARIIIEEHFRGPDQFQKLRDAVRLRSRLTVGKILEDYRAAGCPDRRGHPRQADALEAEHRNLTNLGQWWATHPATKISDTDRDTYWQHRRATVERGTGDRTTELELTTLNNALQWAWRRGDLRELPRSLKTTYRNPEAIGHARDAMPGSGDELHALAAHFFRQSETEVYGWATLLGALTGLRVGELAALKHKPQRIGVHVEPGWYDDRLLVVPRTKRRAGKSVQGEFLLNDATRPHVRPLLEMIRQWRAAQPSPLNTQLLPMRADALTKQLQAAAKTLSLPERQAHGLRAYYCSVRLAGGVSPAQVADELGQLGSGDELVRTVYGATPPQWRGLENVFTWLPNTPDTKPAWSWWSDRISANNIIAI